MARIAIDARELRTSTGRYVERLLHYLQRIDNDNDYLVILKVKDYKEWQPTNKRFQKVATPYKEFTISEQLGFLRQIRNLKADLVHFGMTQQPIFYRGKTITTVHDLTTARFRNPAKNFLVFTLKQGVYKWVINVVARKSNAILAPSEFVKDDLVKFTHVNKDKITVTYEAADKITDGPEAVKSVGNKRFIMYVGRPTPHKNLERLVEAHEILLKKHSDLYLVLVGKSDSNYERIKELVDRKGMANSVIFTGYISDAHLKWLYERTAAYVFPSLSEGFGLPPLEAMTHGAPLVSSNATSIPEVNGEAAHYFNPLNIDDIAKKVDDVLSDSKLREKLIEKGKIQVKKYSWERMAKQTAGVYNQVLNQK